MHQPIGVKHSPRTLYTGLNKAHIMGNYDTLTGKDTESAKDTESDPDPTIVRLTEDGGDDLLSALSSSTARRILEQLRASPSPPSKLADETETSLQNIHYHLDKFEAADAIEVVDMVYSEKGREMNVYAPTGEPLVLIASSEDDRQNLVDALSTLLGSIGVLTLMSVAVQELIERVFYPGGPTTAAPNGGQYAMPPMTNVAPPVGLYVFIVGFVMLLSWFVWQRQ